MLDIMCNMRRNVNPSVRRWKTVPSVFLVLLAGGQVGEAACPGTERQLIGRRANRRDGAAGFDAEGEPGRVASAGFGFPVDGRQLVARGAVGIARRGGAYCTDGEGGNEEWAHARAL